MKTALWSFMVEMIVANGLPVFCLVCHCLFIQVSIQGFKTDGGSSSEVSWHVELCEETVNTMGQEPNIKAFQYCINLAKRSHHSPTFGRETTPQQHKSFSIANSRK